MTPQLQNSEWVAEDDLATQLNVDRAVLLEAREKMAADDVDKEGPWVIWKKTAAAKFAVSLGLVWPAVESAEKTPPAERVTVFSAPRGVNGRHYPNPRIITVLRANGERVNVLVMDSSKYLTRLRSGEPMTFLARQSTSGSHWVLVGREPRFRGAW
jgi:hypothetical protein